MHRRDFLATGAAGAAAMALPGFNRLVRGAARPLPTPAQLQWQRDELALFLHFGVNTFTDREWGDGTEDPAIFEPTALDARQWARAAKAAGARGMILTAKHHDGFCLWPTATTTHSVASSPWRGGTGDVVREFTDACRAEGLRAGLYLSPWDRNAPSYGDSPRYNDFYCAQLTELLTRYGPLNEVWFDGAVEVGPGGKRQEYDWPRIWGLVRSLQPGAVIFSDAGPDVRWIGNERGVAGDPNWSTVNPATVPYPGASGDDVIAMLQHGDPDGHGLAARRDRRVDPARLVLAPRRGRGGADGGRPGGALLHVGGAEREAPAQRAPHPGRGDPPDRRGDGSAGCAGGWTPSLPRIGFPTRLRGDP